MYLAFDVYADFFTFDHEKGRPWKRGALSGDYMGGHAGVAIGYGRTEEGYLIVRNSWGKDWGDGGYFKFSELYERACKAIPPVLGEREHCLLDFGGADVEKIAENIPSVQWVKSEWSDCSVTCGGGGSRMRSVGCVNTASGDVAVGCPANEKPPDTETCGCGECPACEFQAMPAMTYGSENVNEHGGKMELAKEQCVEAMISCTPGDNCCHGISCTGGSTEFQYCLAKKGPALMEAREGENSYAMDCTKMIMAHILSEQHSAPGGHITGEGYSCPVSEWDSWGKCCGSPGWRQRQRTVTNLGDCNGIPPRLVEQETCISTTCIEHKFWLIDNGDGTVSLRGDHEVSPHKSKNATNATHHLRHDVEEEGTGMANIVPAKDGIVVIESVGFVAVGGLLLLLVSFFMFQNYQKKKDDHPGDDHGKDKDHEGKDGEKKDGDKDDSGKDKEGKDKDKGKKGGKDEEDK